MVNDTTKLIYTLMFAFVLYLSYKTLRTRTKLGKEQIKFKAKPNRMMFVLTVLLILMIYMGQGAYIKGIVFAIALYFLYVNFEPIILTDEVIYYGARADKWEDIKQWAYDDKKSQLVIRLKINGRDQQRLLPVMPSDKEEILEEIRKHKKK